jgi:hypothetical protein
MQVPAKYVIPALLAMLVFVGLCPTAAAQAAVESGLGAAHAATSAAPARSAAQGIADALDSLKKAVAAGSSMAPAASLSQPPSPHSTSIEPAPAAESPPAKAGAPEFEDPSHIQAGLEYAELLRRFGPPAISTIDEAGKTTFWYSNGVSSYQIELKDRKVVLVPPNAN